MEANDGPGDAEPDRSGADSGFEFDVDPHDGS
jgi:hypothetical protein